MLSLRSKFDNDTLNRDNPRSSVYSHRSCLNSLRVSPRKNLHLLFMDKTHRLSVRVIENDPDFRELLSGIFERSEMFDLVGSYESIEAFGAEMLKHKPSDSWFPQLMVVDVMSSTDPRVEGASFMSALRAEGLQFATLLISSMEFGALLRVLRKSQAKGWAALQKTSRLTEQDIIESAKAVCSELVLS